METQQLTRHIGELQVENALEEGRRLALAGVSAPDMQEAIMQGLRIVGDNYAAGRCFIADLMVSGMLAKELFGMVSLDIEGAVPRTLGKVVIGTIEGDIHDIGKDLIADALRMRGVEVVDLGVDVSVERFVQAVEEYGPDILAISTSIDSSFTGIKRLVARLRGDTRHEELTIVVGGAIADGRFVKLDGVDYLANDYQGSLEFDVERLNRKARRKEPHRD